MGDVWLTLTRAETHYRERRTLAEAATPGPWEWEWKPDDYDQWGAQGPELRAPEARGELAKYVIESWGHDAWGIDVSKMNADHIAANDPASVIAWCDLMLALIERDRETLKRHTPEQTWTDAVMELPDEATDTLGNLHEPNTLITRQSAIYAEDGSLVAADDIETHCSHDVTKAPWPCPDAAAVAAFWGGWKP